MAESVTVAIPVRNGGALLGEVLESVRRAAARSAASSCSWPTPGRPTARAQLARRSWRRGDRRAPERVLARRHAQPAHSSAHRVRTSPFSLRMPCRPTIAGSRRLLEGFEAADNVGLVFGRYRARPDASVMVRRELDEWFDSLPPEVRGLPDLAEGDGTRSLFFTDANGCVARAAWEQVPFREVRLRGGPAARSRHAGRRVREGLSPRRRRDPLARLQAARAAAPLVRRVARTARGRSDRGAGPLRDMALGVQRAVRDDVALARVERKHGSAPLRDAVLSSLRHHAMRAIGATLGSRAERLPPRLAPALLARAPSRFRRGRGSGSMSDGSKLPRRRAGAGPS